MFPNWLLVTLVAEGAQGFLLDTINSQSQYSCNFESSSCQYTPQYPAFHGLMWIRHQVGNMMSLPAKDHTYNTTGRGHVMYIPPSSEVKPGDKVILQSGIMSGLQGNIAVGFWYTISGGSVPSIRLNVTVVDTVTGRVQTTMKTGQHMHQWYHGCLLANSPSGNVSVIFQANYMYTPGYPAIALDDVTVEHGYTCSKNSMTSSTPPTTTAAQNGTYICTFETNMCIYSVTSKLTGNGDNWSFQTSTPSGSAMTSTDHTLGQPGKGHFMQLTTRQTSGTKFQFHSRSLIDYPSGTYITVDFWYKFPNKGMDLNLYIRDGSKLTVKPIFTRSGREVLGWTHACVSTVVHGPVVLTFEGVVEHSSVSNTILVDDVTIQPGNKCSNAVTLSSTLPTSGQVTCNFELTLCGYTNVAGHSDDFNWLRHRGPTSTTTTGPAQDHTTGRGYYMYIETSSPRASGDKALLESSSFVAHGNQSLSFWYNTYGTRIGSLNVYLENLTETGTILGEPVFRETRAMTSDKAWKQGCFEIPKIIGETRVVFEGVVGGDFHSDIAIDDVKLGSGDCLRTTFAHWLSWEQWSSCSHTCGNAVRERRRTCSTFGCMGSYVQRENCTYVYCEVSCSFESAPVCGYVNKKDDFTWSWHQGQTGSSATGPDADHTTGNGYYMYIESSSPRKPGDTATLQSPHFDPDGIQRLTFWYSAYGTSIGSLSVTLEYKTFLGIVSHHSDLFKTTTGTSSRKWSPVCVDIPALHDDSYIVFQGTVGSGYNGDIGIDDVKLERGNCNSFRTTPVPTTSSTSTSTTATTVTTMSTTRPTMTSTSMTSSVKTSLSSAKTQSTTRDLATNTSPHTTSIVGSWSHWYSGPCSVTCGNGTRIRVRHCSTGNDVHCGGAGVDNIACNDGPCPVDGSWGAWSSLSTCAVTCGSGHMTSSRMCNNPTPVNNGLPCQGNSTRQIACQQPSCIVNGSWSEWQAWSTCSASCNSGTRTRDRSCDNPVPQNGGKSCVGNTSEVETCNNVTCPNWSHWFYEPCSATCGNGTMVRIRHCSTGNDVDCGGQSLENVYCSDGGCPDWSRWFYEPCSATCGNGTMVRIRHCSSGNDVDCGGESLEKIYCNDGGCPVHGNWGVWGPYSACSVTCGDGNMTSARTCDSPIPLHGGNSCQGEAVRIEPCHLTACVVDGEWSSWNVWSSCSASCATGSRSRSRTCDQPLASNGGLDCTGSNNETEKCNDIKCPEWSEWYHGNCHVTCGPGNTTRIRYCSSGNDVDCGNGTTMETVACDGGPCPVNGGWGSWSAWGVCSESCGNGTRDRNRKCDNPSPQYGGKECTGIARDTDLCHVTECPYWLPYQQNSACSVTCGRGFQSWIRNCSTGMLSDCTGSKFDERVCVLDPCV